MADFGWVRETKPMSTGIHGSNIEQKQVEAVNRELVEGWRILQIVTETKIASPESGFRFPISWSYYILGR